MTEAIDELERQVKPSDKANKKLKATIYLTEEAQKAFDELFISRFRKNRKIDRSTIACEALQALYERELSCC